MKYNITIFMYYIYVSIDEEDVRIVSMNKLSKPRSFNILGNSMYLKSTKIINRNLDIVIYNNGKIMLLR